MQARWSADGRWLYFLNFTGQLMRAAVSTSTPERIGRPEPLFDLGVGSASIQFEQYAVHRDRFLALRPPKQSAPPTVVIVSNWTAGLNSPSREPSRDR